jgi:glycolate oxidase FAD binding subunit
VARGGGKVVKNVAGFDLPRLFCGSLGTLGLVAEVVFRVHPLPEASATVVFQGLEAADVRATVLALRAVAVEPTASAALGTEDRRFTLLVRFEGFAPGVRDQVDRTLGRAGAGAKAEGGEEDALWAGHDRLRTAGGVRVKATFAPAGLAQAVEALRPLAGALREPALVVYPAIGVAFVGGELDRPGEALAAVVRAVESARRALQPLGSGALVIAEAPPELHARVDAWGPVPSAIEVMRRLKRELDPDGRLAPGRFVGGI